MKTKLLAGREAFRTSGNKYDWLGDGIYFWEGDPKRAHKWAVQKFGDNGTVIGAEIDLKHCFDLSTSVARTLLLECYEDYVEVMSVECRV